MYGDSIVQLKFICGCELEQKARFGRRSFHLELGLLLGPVGVGGEHSVKELLRDRFSPPLMR